MSSSFDELAKKAVYTFWGYVGFIVEERSANFILISLKLDPHHMNVLGIVHGGVLMTMLDQAMGLVLLDETNVLVTSHMTTHFLSNTNNGKIYCKAELLHRTKRTITVRASIYDEQDRILAYASGSYRLLI